MRVVRVMRAVRVMRVMRGLYCSCTCPNVRWYSRWRRVYRISTSVGSLPPRERTRRLQ